MSDFCLSSRNGQYLLTRTVGDFRPSGTFSSKFWEGVWIAPHDRSRPPFQFFEHLGRDLCREVSQHGGFAIAAISKSDGRAVVVRDAFGLVVIRALTEPEGTTIFSGPSLPTEDVAINYDRISSFVTRIRDFGTDDYFENVTRLRPGEIWSSGSDEQNSTTWEPRIESDLATRLRVALQAATPESDAFTLSGGLDSASVVASSPGATGAWTIRFREASGDEVVEAKETADALGVSFHVFDPDDKDLPFGDPSFHACNNTWGFGPMMLGTASVEAAFYRQIAKETEGEIVVGTGADQALLSNFDIAIREDLYAARFRQLASQVRNDPRRGTRQILASILRKFIKKTPIVPPSPLWWDAPLVEATLEGSWRSMKLSLLQTWEWESVTRLLESHARAADRAISTPWLNVDLWRVVLAASPSQLRAGHRSKGLLREAMRGYMPDRARTSPKAKSPTKCLEHGIGVVGYETVLHHFERSKLGVHTALRPGEFIDYFKYWSESVVAAYPDGQPIPTLPVWTPIAAEMWLHGANA